ncbi:ThiF family adenylyltransferase [Herbiconiux sp. L3-i23]|uniref:ThiF family adenylyltransferase n=1 Tax=Herbiconiux sp. L3-i23 TaxID=2905871 RepID=UPI002048F1B2|nr:ThiF family adenylyltransferase [Herbiconiux sp. L3-i23]BDI21852.1 adenylyltransferase/sulfurtransferase MoeZ [Herbiconiux sp. L3-i23]
MRIAAAPDADTVGAGSGDSRWARFSALPGFGSGALRGLRDARVLVVGAGGLGSTVLPAIVAAGVGAVVVVDDDVVEESNLPRQSLHSSADVGRPKVESALDRLVTLSSGTVTGHRVRVTAETAPALLDGIDLIVDGSDNFDTRYLVDDAARERGVPVVWGAVSQYGGQVGLSWEGRGPIYRDLFPEPPAPGTVLSCAEGGILPSVCTVIGGLMAAQVLAVLTGTADQLLGRVTSYDAKTARTRELTFGIDPDAPWRTAAPTDETPEPHREDPAVTLPDDWQHADEIDAAALRDLLASGAPVQLIDVREPWEVEIAALPDAHPLPMSSATADALDDLDRDVPIVAYCHHGMRSERMLAALRAAGFEGTHLAGGIDAWSRDIDPSVARY